MFLIFLVYCSTNKNMYEITEMEATPKEPVFLRKLFMAFLAHVSNADIF